MNIFNTQQIHTQGQGTTPSTDVLDVLGNSLQLDQSSLKLLEQNGELDGMGFDQLLKLSEENPEALEALISGAQKKQESQLAKLTNSIVDFSKNKTLSTEEVLGDSPENVKEKANILQLGKSEFKTPADTNSVKQQSSSTTNSDLSKILNSGKSVDTQELQKNMKVTQEQKSELAQNLQKETVRVENKSPVKGQVTSAEKLVNLNQFMANQPGSVHKRAIAQNSYKPITKSMFSAKVEASTPAVSTVTQEQISLKDIMLGQGTQDSSSSMEQGFSQSQNMKTAANINTVNTQNNVFDISSLQGATSTDQVITKIQDYITQSKVSNQQDVQMSFEHDKLGKVDLHVEKAHNNTLNISIGARSLEGARFFQQHQGELLATLSHAGINVGDLKLETSSSNNQSSSDNSKQEFSQNSKQGHQSESGQKDEDSRKRKELWSTFQDKEVA